jgi:hypothetical protein
VFGNIEMPLLFQSVKRGRFNAQPSSVIAPALRAYKAAAVVMRRVFVNVSIDSFGARSFRLGIDKEAEKFPEASCHTSGMGRGEKPKREKKKPKKK